MNKKICIKRNIEENIFIEKKLKFLKLHCIFLRVNSVYNLDKLTYFYLSFNNKNINPSPFVKFDKRFY